MNGEGTLRAHGDVGLQRAGQGTVVDSRPIRLRSGDVVSVRHGDAKVSLPGSGKLELRDGSTVRFRSGAALEAGSLLVESGTSPVRVDAGVGEFIIDGIAHVDHELAAGIGVYKGKATLKSGREVNVGWLRQVTVPSVGVAPDPEPLRVDSADPWDQRFLGTAIDLTSQLDGQTRYVNANAPAGAGETPAFYRRTLRPLEATPSFDDYLLRSVVPDGSAPAPGDAFVAASIALSAPGPFPERWKAIFDLRSKGAQWGIVVLDQRADPAAVLALVGGSVNESALAPRAAAPVDAALSGAGQPVIVPGARPAPLPAGVSPPLTTPVVPTTTRTRPTTTSPPRPKPTSPPSTVLPPPPSPVPTVPQSQDPAPAPPTPPAADPLASIARSLLGLGG